MKSRLFLIALTVWFWPAFVLGQSVNIGDILCSDGSTVSKADFPTSGKTAEGIVFFVDPTGQNGWAVNLGIDALDTDWVNPDHYYDGYDIPELSNNEYSRQALFDLDGYQNTVSILLTHGPDWYPAAWCVDYEHDWYLPAAGQMRWLLAYVNEINESLAVVNGTPFVLPYPDWHWTSTERDGMHSMVVSRLGSVSNYMKWNYYHTYTIGVRSIRDFSCNSTAEHRLGDVVVAPDGQKGVVFYVSPEDNSYWLTALNDLPGSYAWGPNEDLPELSNIANTMEEWYGIEGIYCGYDATQAMRNAQGNNPSYASNHVDLEHGWHIPSTGQLSKLYAAMPHIEGPLLANGGTLPSGDYYWCSTECSSSEAWTIDFGANVYTEGSISVKGKQTPYKVRPVWSQSCEIPLPEPSMPDNILESDCNAPLEGFEWGIREDWSSGTGIYCRIMPMVGDLDDDGIPEIICFDMQGSDATQPLAKTINVFDGRNKNLKAQISVNDMVWSHGNGPFGLVKLPNRKGLIVTACMDTKLRAYDITSSNPSAPVWVSNARYNTGNNDFSVSLGFADFDGDGHPEIYVRDKIFDAETGTLLAITEGGGNQADSYSHGSHTNHNKLSCPIAFDVCGDARQELVLGNEIYDVVITNRNGTTGNHATLIKTITPPNGIGADGHVQVADFNLDGHPDILVSNRNTEGATGTVSFYVWDVFNNRTSAPIQLSTSFIGKSIPLIADFDNDGQLEILIDCCHESNLGLRAYRFSPTTNSFNYLWSLPIDEDSYSNTATLFDFNGDNKNELVFSDNSYLWVYDASVTPPTLLSQIDCGQITIMHVPIVADVDGDGSADIVVTGKEGGYLVANTKLKVFKSSTEPWRPARKVWNQYMYHVTNVNEDLTIPTYCYNIATTFTTPDGGLRRPYNNFLQQAGYITPDGEPYNPDGYHEVDISGAGCVNYTFNGITYTESGNYDQLVESEEGCDTLYHITVNLGGTVSHEWSQQACSHFTWNNITYSEPGDYVQEFTNDEGCDSIVTLHLTFADALEYNVDTTACQSLWWNGQEYTEPGVYTQQFVDSDGCDSIVHLHLSFGGQPEAIPEIDGPTEVNVSTDLILGQYFYSIDTVSTGTNYEWLLVGADWVMDTTGTQCSILVTTPGTATLTVRVWNECGYTEQEIVIQGGFFDVDDNSTLPVKIYPNPAHDKVLIEAEGIVKVKLFDLLGQCLVEKEGDGDKMEISLKDLVPAVYAVEILTKQGRIIRKLNVTR